MSRLLSGLRMLQNFSGKLFGQFQQSFALSECFLVRIIID